MRKKNYSFRLPLSLCLIGQMLWGAIANAQCPPTPFDVTVTGQTAASCPSNGTVTLGGNGVGNSDVTYKIVAAPNTSYLNILQAGTANTFSNLQPGSYTIEMGCIGSQEKDSVTFSIVDNYTEPSGTVTSSTSCSGSPGITLSLSNIGGSATPLQYAFARTGNPNYPDSLLTYGTATSFNDTVFGSYIVRIKDACGAVLTQTINVPAPPTYYTILGPVNNTYSANCDTVNSNVQIVGLVGNIVPAGGLTLNVYSETSPGSCIKGPLYFTLFMAAGTNLSSHIAKIPAHDGFIAEIVNSCGQAGLALCANKEQNDLLTKWEIANASCNAVTADTVNLMHRYDIHYQSPVTYCLYSNGVQVGCSQSASNPIFTGLPTAGNTYSIVATDACGKDDTVSFATPAGAVTFSDSSFVNPSCVGYDYVQAFIRTFGGNIPKAQLAALKIVSGPSRVGDTISGPGELPQTQFDPIQVDSLLPGTYTIAIIYPSGACADYPAQFTLNVPPFNRAPSLNATVNQSCGGTASIICTYGQPDTDIDTLLLRDVSTGIVVQTNTNTSLAPGVFTNVPAGTYEVEYRWFDITCNTNFGIVPRDTVTVLPQGTPPQVQKKFGFICEDAGGNQLSTGQALFFVSGVQPYNVYYNTTNTLPATPQLTGQNSNSIIINGLTAGQTYYFWFLDSCGNISGAEQLGILPFGPATIEQATGPCVNSPFTLSMPEYPGATYTWTKGGSTLSNTRDYIIGNYTAANNGTYTGTITLGGCLVRTININLHDSLCNMPLPVVLRSFTAREQQCGAALAWQTAREVGFSHFNIQYSPYGTAYTTVGRVPAQRSSTGSQYTFFYQQPKGKGYYRLEMVNIDGSAAYSEVVTILTGCEKADAARLLAYPSPAKTGQALKVSYMAGNNEGAAYLIITDRLGGMQVRRQVAVRPGANEYNVETAHLAPGIYFVKIEAAGGSFASGVVKIAVVR